jgi:hypothetical protein
VSLPISTQTERTIEGIGENSSPKSSYKDRGAEGNGGGGDGWPGGFASKATGIDSNTGGSGGSSYITGFPDCKTNFNIQFIDPSLIGGKILIFSPTREVETGHTDHGYARIRFIQLIDHFYPSCYKQYSFILLNLFKFYK